MENNKDNTIKTNDKDIKMVMSNLNYTKHKKVLKILESLIDKKYIFKIDDF